MQILVFIFTHIFYCCYIFNIINSVRHPFPGQKFRAKVVQALLEDYSTIYSPTQNETKASISVRAIKSIKMRIICYLTYKDDYNYLPVLQDIAATVTIKRTTELLV